MNALVLFVVFGLCKVFCFSCCLEAFRNALVLLFVCLAFPNAIILLIFFSSSFFLFSLFVLFV